MTVLRGARELRNRLHAMQQANARYPRTWADEYIAVARPQIPFRTGKTRRSLEVRTADAEGAEIEGSQVAVFIDTGTRAHGIEPKREALKFQKGGRTIFARKVDHPGTRARPYRVRALGEALRRRPLDENIIDAWNGAA